MGGDAENVACFQENLPRFYGLLPTFGFRRGVVKFKCGGTIATKHEMGIEFLACFALKTFDESCALGRQEVFRLRFGEGDAAYLAKDVEIATFTLAFRHLGEDAHGVLTAHRTTIRGILGLRYL